MMQRQPGKQYSDQVIAGMVVVVNYIMKSMMMIRTISLKLFIVRQMRMHNEYDNNDSTIVGGVLKRVNLVNFFLQADSISIKGIYPGYEN